MAAKVFQHFVHRDDVPAACRAASNGIRILYVLVLYVDYSGLCMCVHIYIYMHIRINVSVV